MLNKSTSLASAAASASRAALGWDAPAERPGSALTFAWDGERATLEQLMSSWYARPSALRMLSWWLARSEWRAASSVRVNIHIKRVNIFF